MSGLADTDCTLNVVGSVRCDCVCLCLECFGTRPGHQLNRCQHVWLWQTKLQVQLSVVTDTLAVACWGSKAHTSMHCLSCCDCKLSFRLQCTCHVFPSSSQICQIACTVPCNQGVQVPIHLSCLLSAVVWQLPASAQPSFIDSHSAGHANHSNALRSQVASLQRMFMPDKCISKGFLYI